MARQTDNQKLLRDITSLMTDPQQAANEKKITGIINKVRSLDASKAPDQLRLAACHFMTMYHTRKAMTLGMPQDTQGMPVGMGGPMGAPGSGGGVGGGASASGDTIDLVAVEKFKDDQRKDMELGWNLLDIKGGNTQAARTARVLRIEVAQRLEDSYKLKEAFDELMAKQLSEEETMVAFTAAPFLGDWKAMMRLGKRIEKMSGGLEQLHMMSLQLPIPDFTLVYSLCKQHDLSRYEAPPIEELQSLGWELYNVEKIRVRFKDVDCGEFDEKRKELMDEIEKQGDVEWEEVPNCSHVHIKRMGGLCQAVSFGEIPMMLNGPFLDREIHVKGRTEMPLMPEETGAANMGPMGMPPDQITILVQEEEWVLKQSTTNPKLFAGSYTLRQRPELPPQKKMTPEHAPVNMSFDCEVYLKQEIIGKLKGGTSSLRSADERKMASSFADDEEEMTEDAPIGTLESHPNKPAEDAIVTEFDDLELD